MQRFERLLLEREFISCMLLQALHTSVVHKENIEIKSCLCQVAAYKKVVSSVKLTVPPKKVAVAYETWLFSRVCDCSDWKGKIKKLTFIRR